MPTFGIKESQIVIVLGKLPGRNPFRRHLKNDVQMKRPTAFEEALTTQGDNESNPASAVWSLEQGGSCMLSQSIFVLTVLLMAPVTGRSHEPDSLPESIPQRLPPSVPRRAPGFAEPQDSTVKLILQNARPVGFAEQLPAPKPESVPPGTLIPSPTDNRGMSLADLEMMGVTNNPSVARAAALVRAARGNHLQVGLPPNPSVGYEGQQIGSHGLAEQDGVFVAQELVRGGKLKLNRQIAAQQWARAEQELAAQRLRVLTDVRVAYYRVLIAQRQETLSNELLGVAREALKVAGDLLRGKEVGAVDVVQARIEAENTEILSQNSINRRAAAWQSLSTVVGDPQLPMHFLNGDFEEARPEYKWEASLQLVMTHSPEISAAIARLEETRWSVQRAIAEPKPNVTVQGLYNWRDNGIGGRPDGAITVGVPLPVWDRNQGRILQAQNEAAAAHRALDQLQLSLQNRLAAVYERYANALSQVTRYRSRILPAAQESLDLMQKLYEGGETTYVNLLTAQRTYSQTNLNYLESLGALRTAEAEIEGLLLMGSLESR